MITKIINSFLLFTICLLLTASVSAQQILNANELAGTYFAGHDFGGSSIELKADGTYSQGHGSCTYSTEESGKFYISNGVVRFTILKYTGKQFSDEAKEVDLFNAKARKEFFDYDEDEELEPFETEFSLVAVKWGERIYLIYESALKDFSNAVNLGVEPRAEMRSEPYFGAFFLREGDEQKSVSGKPTLPAEWQPFLLSKPVNAKIVAAEKQGEDTLGIIDRGSRDGLKAGMILLGKDEQPSPFSREGVVVSVEEKSAKILIFDLKVGDTVNSKYVAKNAYK